MELKLEKLMLKESPNIDMIYGEAATTVAAKNEMSIGSDNIDDDDVPFYERAEERLVWLRSQIIGRDVEFDSPFGKRRLSYADHTASGRSLHYIENFILRNVLPFYGNTHTSDSYVGHHTTKLMNDAIMYIKKCLGSGEEEALLFCGSGTTSAIKRLQEVMAIAVPSTMRERVIKTLSNEERWIVFVGPYEHHSNLLSWQQSLAEVVEIGMDENGILDIEMLRSQLEAYRNKNEGKRPILGSFSACSNVTGIYSDTRAVAKLLHQYGGFACFDFAASGPYVQIDMRSGEIDGYDAIFLSTHKFLGGPGSPGILLMNKNLYKLKSSPPSTCGGGTVSYVNGFNEKDTLYLDNIEERESGGTPHIIGIVRASLAFGVKEYISYQVIEKQEHQYIERALKRLLPNKNISILGNTSAKRQAILSFVIYSSTNLSLDCIKNKLFKTNSREKLHMWRELGSMRAKPLHGPFVAALLSDLFGIQARGGCSCAGPYGHRLLNINETCSSAYRSAIAKGYAGIKPGWTRVSFPYYLPNEEFEFILTALEFIAVYGQRFLPLYAFNLRTGSWTLKKEALTDLLKKKNYSKGHILALEKQNLDAETKVAAIISKQRTYLEAARTIANLLRKFPPERKLHEDIGFSLLHFRI